jgi:trehalose-6-phosphate synthase
MDYHMRDWEFPKKGSEIKEKAKKKIEQLKAKVETRRTMISEQAAALGIKSVEEALTRMEEFGHKPEVEDQVAFSKIVSNRNKVKSEWDEIEKLKLLARNLPDDGEYKLDFAALEYFGF